MNQRTKFLLIAMSVVAVFWLGDLGYVILSRDRLQIVSEN